MAYIVKYLSQDQLEFAERMADRKFSREEIDARMATLKVDSEAGAERLVKHFRNSGHIASYVPEHEAFKG